MVIRKDLETSQPSGSTAVALGYFDGVHIGHQAVLNCAVAHKKEGLIPGAFTFSMDKSSPEKKMASKAIQTLEDRLSAIKGLGIEELYCPDFEDFKNMSPYDFVVESLIKGFKAKVICCGDDFRFGKDATGTTEELCRLCKDNNVEVHIIKQVLYKEQPISSTRIRKEIAEGNMEQTAALLGRLFSIKGQVIHGRKLGRTIGFPTINQRFTEGVAVPKFGVYATILTMEDGKKYAGATNVGVKPTVGSDEVLAETFIVNFNGDVYSQEIKVEFLSFLRGEQQFSGIEELKQAISENAVEAKKIYEKYQKQNLK